jgi:predicted nucleotidyltransferase
MKKFGNIFMRIGAAMKKRIRQLIESLLPCDPERLYVFGSWARDEEDMLSDLDVVVIQETPLPFFERLRKVSSLLPQQMGAVDILVYTPEEFATMQREGNAFAEMIAEEGSLVYDRETKR